MLFFSQCCRAALLVRALLVRRWRLTRSRLAVSRGEPAEGKEGTASLVAGHVELEGRGDGHVTSGHVVGRREQQLL